MKERVILVNEPVDQNDGIDSSEELNLLAASAGAMVVGTVTTQRKSPNPATFLGKGKVEELSICVRQNEADLVVMNHEISPGQERNLERAVKCRVLDRTGLILDIFAQRAATSEGKLQVELAQLRHLSTRLVRGWTHLERQKGGIGLRGPGETQLETDRRLIGQRIKHLRRRLDRVESQREVRRKSRRKVPIPTVCLVGYTNAGKSSLFNNLTDAGVMSADLLFATLDPTMRRLMLPGGDAVVLSDTVGFIRDLPHPLVKAFHSTLEEVVQATLLLHVVDSSDPARDAQAEQVLQVLQEIGAGDLPVITVFNKIDLTGNECRSDIGEDGFVDKVWLSALSGSGLEKLCDAIQQRVSYLDRPYVFHIPAQAAEVRAYLYRHARVLEEDYEEEGEWVIKVEISESEIGRLQNFELFSVCSMSKYGQNLAQAQA